MGTLGFNLPGISGVYGPVKIIVYAVRSPVDDLTTLLSWKEEGKGQILDIEVEGLNSSSAEDYGLDHPPGYGVWAFDGTIKLTFGKSNHPLDPPEYDHDLHWEGEWRPPTDEELSEWRGRKPKHTTYQKEEDGTFSFQCPGYKDGPKEPWKIYCKLRRGHDGPHVF
jgi:hypothetical protein